METATESDRWLDTEDLSDLMKVAQFLHLGLCVTAENGQLLIIFELPTG